MRPMLWLPGLVALSVVSFVLSPLAAAAQDIFDGRDEFPGGWPLLIPNAPPQPHAFYVDGDVDWVSFWGVTGRQYVVFTSELGVGNDTQLELFRPGMIIIATDDNGGGGLASRIAFTATRTGIYYVKISRHGGLGTGTYKVSLQTPTSMHADFNGDGKRDLIWQHTDGRVTIWLMNGASVIGSGNVLGPETGWELQHVADLNGDGKSDIIWRHGHGQVVGWLMNGLSVLAAGTLFDEVSSSPRNIVSVGDFNGDGKQDLLWRTNDPTDLRFSGECTIWLMDGLSSIGGGVGGCTFLSSGWPIAVGDLNGDGKSDLVVENLFGDVSLRLMNGNTTVSSSNVFSNPFNDPWSVSWVGDFNGDGKQDLLWRHADGSVALWLMNGLSVISGGTVLGPATLWAPVRIADLNGDGKSDIVWEQTSGAVFVWLMDGMSVLAGSRVVDPDSVWRVSVAGDLDGNGTQDLLWRSIDDGTVTMWLMNGLDVIGSGRLLGGNTGWSLRP